MRAALVERRAWRCAQRNGWPVTKRWRTRWRPASRWRFHRFLWGFDTGDPNKSNSFDEIENF